MEHEPLAVLVPVLRRPHRVAPLLESLERTTPAPWALYFVADPDDFAELAAIDDAKRQRTLDPSPGRGVDLMRIGGNYATKINAAVALTCEPLLFLGADDLSFTDGWLDAALRRLRPGIGVVGTNDLCNPRTDGEHGDHSTHSLVTREYVEFFGTIDEPGKALHAGYPHEFVDDEFVATAKARGAYEHAVDSVVEHLHPMVGKAPMDELYAAQRARMRRGARVFRRREHLWAS